MNSQLPAAAPAPRRNWVRRLVNLLVALVVIAVAAATFVFSYDGVHAIALLGGMSTQLARYYPGLFDAVLVIACVAAVVLRDGRWWARAWAWVVLVVVLAAIGATDVVHAINYTLRQRTTEGIVAAAPVVAVLLAFSLLLTLLRQSRSRAAGDEPGDLAAGQPATMPVPLGLPALPAAPSAADTAAMATMANRTAVAASAAGPDAADAATVETPAMTAGPAPRGPIALPAGPEKGPLTPPDGLSAMTRSAATEPSETLPPAAPPVASQRAPEGEPAPPTVASPAVSPARAPAEPQEPENPAPARAPGGIRYAGSGALGRVAGEAAAEPAADDYWDGDDAGQFAGLVYPAREAGAHPEAAADHGDGSGTGRDDEAGPGGEDDNGAGDDDGTEASGPTRRTEPVEVDEDAPPFATAPFAAVPRLNRVRSMPVPPEDDEAE